MLNMTCKDNNLNDADGNQNDQNDEKDEDDDIRGVNRAHGALAD